MRRALVPASTAALAALLLSACVVPPRPGDPVPSAAGVLAADARALRFGATAPAIFDNPELRDKLQAMFGGDWGPSARLAAGAPAYFPATSSIRLLRVAEQDYIAVSGCVPAACAPRPGLLLVRQDGQHLLARLDEGGFSHYYHFTTGASPAPPPRALIDGAWLAVARLERR